MVGQIDDLGNIGIVVADWDIANSYRPRTITCDYTSWIAYISRKPVPANTPITDTEYWKPIFRLDKTVAFNYESFKEYISSRMNSLINVVETFLSSKEGGTPLAKELGNSDVVGVAQSTITDAINRIWNKLEDITGETLNGINMTINPPYFIGENGCVININARSLTTAGIFEYIAFYLNGELLIEANNVETLEHQVNIEDTSVIKCVAKILGITYTREQSIIHYNSFWLGAGKVYSEIMDDLHVIPITNGMRGAYDVKFKEDDNLFIVVGSSLRSGFLRADLNSFEIPFNESTVVVEGTEYKVFTSVNTYKAGTYNIDING